MRLQCWLRFGGFIGCALFMACGVVGCNHGPELPPLASMTGTVTLDGKPVTTGIVVFIPDREKSADGPMGIGVIDKEGHYTISTVEHEGALVGHHKIRVEDPLGRGWAVPARYANADQSGLTFEVKAGEKNVRHFKLTTKP